MNRRAPVLNLQQKRTKVTFPSEVQETIPHNTTMRWAHPDVKDGIQVAAKMSQQQLINCANYYKPLVGGFFGAREAPAGEWFQAVTRSLHGSPTGKLLMELSELRRKHDQFEANIKRRLDEVDQKHNDTVTKNDELARE
ncbi:hypothetical protein BGX38DRAFT_1142016 [Terfezia claveryi]|nr:hypothetical protein BGX38DRAFT_1142016 [Terfezia claveryi]